MRLYKIHIMRDTDDNYETGGVRHADIHVKAESLQAAKKTVGEGAFMPNFVKLHDHYWAVGMVNRVECVKRAGNPYVWSGDSFVSYPQSQDMKEAWVPIGQVERHYMERTRIESVEKKLVELLESDSISLFPAGELENAFPSCFGTSPTSEYNIPMTKKIEQGGVRIASRKVDGCEIGFVEVYFPKQLNTHLGWPDERHLFEMMHLEKFRRWALFAGKRWSDRHDEDCPSGSRSYGPFEVPRAGIKRIAEAYSYRGNLEGILSMSPDELRSQE